MGRAAAVEQKGCAPDLPLVAPVVVTWQGGEVTRRCVDSLGRQTYSRLHIVVVDNASDAAERAALEAAFGPERPAGRQSPLDVDLLVLEGNRHFAGGLNAGARRALAAGAEFILVLNNDTVLEPTAVAELVRAATERPAAGLVGPKLVQLDHPRRVISVGERHSLWGLCLPRTLLRHRPHGTRPVPVSGLMGSAVLLRRQCFERVGDFWEEIAAYYEDVDYCLRTRAAGFEIACAPAAVVRHDGLRGFKSGATPFAAYLKARNLWFLMRRHARPWHWAAFLPTYVALVTTSAALYLLRGRARVAAALARGAYAGFTALGPGPA
jgi:GT2 family glycosyltransferase